MHLILLIWNKNKHYNTPPRLVVLIREICNEIIYKAREYNPSEQIFQLIEEDAEKACFKLATQIDMCTKFKEAYFEYKKKANNTWKLTTNALFVRLDSFMERCHDILHLANTIVQFSKLQNIVLGGTKGKSLTDTLK
jgi:dynein heavy chain, axonemal